MITVLSKIVQDFVFTKVRNVSEILNTKYQNAMKESSTKIEELTQNVKKLNEQISTNKKTLENPQFKTLKKEYNSTLTLFVKLTKDVLYYSNFMAVV